MNIYELVVWRNTYIHTYEHTYIQNIHVYPLMYYLSIRILSCICSSYIQDIPKLATLILSRVNFKILSTILSQQEY